MDDTDVNYFWIEIHHPLWGKLMIPLLHHRYLCRFHQAVLLNSIDGLKGEWIRLELGHIERYCYRADF